MLNFFPPESRAPGAPPCPKCGSPEVKARPDPAITINGHTYPAGIRFTCGKCRYAWLRTKGGANA